ncbi:MAG TPA: hypothetical protein VJT68_09985 [Thermoleophilaceae bacterium]|nr:hypothetical protein [Thermoleophilaceae bacterium]
MHLRRALLLFAIVLGMAALVASLSRPIEDRNGQSTTRTETEPETAEPGPPTATPGTGGAGSGTAAAPRTISFDAAEPDSRKLPAGDSATVEVSVDEPGSVEIPDMGLTAPADPFTPARFDVLASRPGRYRLLFTPAGGEQEAEPAGSLVVISRG